MDSRIKSLWIKKLRSNQVQQSCTGLLRPLDGTYDALGVLCEVSRVDRWQDDGDCFSYSGCVACLPDEVRALARITSEQEETIIYLNDTKKLSFSEIADYIKKNF